MMATILETERLRLREFTREDMDPLAKMVADPEQMRFYPRPRTEAEVSAWIDRNIWLYESLGFGFWVIESPNTEFLGYCGLRSLASENAQEIEMGWHTRKEVWSQGIATEAATACRDLAFDRFGIGRLVATIDPAHDASLRVATKVGMRREREIVLDGWPCVIYSIARGSLRRPAEGPKTWMIGSFKNRSSTTGVAPRSTTPLPHLPEIHSHPSAKRSSGPS